MSQTPAATTDPTTPARNRPRVEGGAIATIKYSDRSAPERFRIGQQGETRLEGPVPTLAWDAPRVRPLVEGGAEVGDVIEIELPNGTLITATVNSILPRQARAN